LLALHNNHNTLHADKLHTIPCQAISLDTKQKEHHSIQLNEESAYANCSGRIVRWKQEKGEEMTGNSSIPWQRERRTSFNNFSEFSLKQIPTIV
jgi:hypothetical protein